jgi:hypothetical protein
MKAINRIKEKETRDDGLIIERVVWQLDEPLPGSAHLFKYRLYCGCDGECWVRYDNERGKGDHRHIKGRAMNLEGWSRYLRIFIAT